MTEKKQPDWEKIELDYRAGIKTLREIASEHGLSDGAVRKRAKRDDWGRDLTAKINKKAEDLVRKNEVRMEARKKTAYSEREIIEANALNSANIQVTQRKDLTRFHTIANNLFEEMEAITGNDNAGVLKQLSAWIEDEGLTSEDAIVMFERISTLPSRVKMAKDLADTLAKLIPLERTVYKMDVEEKNSDDSLTNLLTAIAVGNKNNFTVVADDPEY